MSDAKAIRALEARNTRYEKVLEAAIIEAEANGYQWITREGVAARAGVSTGTVNHAFDTMRELKREVLRQAVKREILSIVFQGLADDHEIVRGASSELKKAALQSKAFA